PRAGRAALTASQALLVAVLSGPVLGQRVRGTQAVAVLAGVGGVALVVGTPQARLDGVGVLAGVGAAVAAGFGILLTRRWGRPGPARAGQGGRPRLGRRRAAPRAGSDRRRRRDPGRGPRLAAAGLVAPAAVRRAAWGGRRPPCRRRRSRYPYRRTRWCRSAWR